MSGTMIIYLVLIVILNISLIVFYFSHLKLINPYLKYGLVFAVILMVLDAANTLLILEEVKNTDITRIIVVGIVNYIKATIYVGIGIFCCVALNIKDIPLVKRLFTGAEQEYIDFRRYCADIVAVVFGFVLYSFILLKITAPETSQILKSFFGSGTQINLATILFVISFAYVEEISFRLAIQNFLARMFKLEGRKYWIAIVVTAIIWTLAHSGTLNPEWVKYAQVFPLGIALGYLYKKHGAECCIFTHMLFNIVMIFVGSSFLSV